MTALVVEQAEDWTQLDSADAVVDPMVFRYGERFLGGRSAAGHQADATWRALSNDVGAIALFFDQVVVRDRIPLFNYGDTFDSGLNLGGRLLAAVNKNEELLVEVDVRYGAYWEAKSAALEEVGELIRGRRQLPAELSRELLRHLKAVEYQWHPNVDVLALKQQSSQVLAAFLVGGLIFSAYAQQIGGVHVVQPKRARLFAAVSIGVPNLSEDFEHELFKQVGAVVESVGGTATHLSGPSFLPLLLERGKPTKTPLHLLDRALALRAQPAMRDYRHLMRQLTADWAVAGRVDPKARRALQRQAAWVAKELGVADREQLFSAKLDVFNVATGGSPVEAGLDLVEVGGRLRGWIFPGLINRGVRKLLTESAQAELTYPALAQALRSRWIRA